MSGREVLLVGLSHKSAPIAVRERVALSGDALKEALGGLRGLDGVEEAMVVSTCNRVEVYVVGQSLDSARRFFLDRSGEASEHLYQKQGPEAVRHLFRVAASLDSMVVGEQQILGQVKEAYGLASAAGTAGPVLSRLCNRAFGAAKRVRSETEIGRGASSVSQVAVELVQKIFGDLRGRVILLVGAGKMGALSAKALRDLGADRVLVTNRSAERGQALAEQVGGQAEPWERLVSLLALADVVLVSTGAPSYVLTRDLAGQVMKLRRGRSICFIDVAVPRNVDPACADLANVYAYDIDDLQKVVHQTRQMRAEEAIRAEVIVEAEVGAFAREREARAALPVLASLRRRAEAIARTEVERTLAHVGGRLDEKARRSVEAMALAIVNKLLHGPTARLKQAASSGDTTLPGAAAELFDIDSEQPSRREEPGGEAVTLREPKG
ncbi:MAG TPA: glutamyl-tRNA reductase [Anaeromyxobacteraceae bacterium]|nr:glutamyl-tRNA reductase [Anaeromyxobacteraceae bacterium]